MNIELIRRYKSVFLWLLEDESRSCRVKYDHWLENSYDIEGVFSEGPVDEDIVAAIVINDDYVDFRMAEADGKQLQHTSEDGWVNIYTPTFILPLKHYRIKPSAPDWAEQLDGTSENGVICKFPSKDIYIVTDAEDVPITSKPITPDDLHPWQRKGWVKAKDVIDYYNDVDLWGGMSSKFKDWLKSLL